MKKKFSMLLALVALAWSAQAGNYKITVNFPDASQAGKKAYLTSFDTGSRLDSAIVKGKRATFQGTVEGSCFITLSVGADRCSMVLEDGNVQVDWSSMMATGAPLNEALNKFGDEMQRAKTSEEYFALLLEFYKQNRENALGVYAYYSYLMGQDYSLAQLDSALSAAPASYRAMKRFQGMVASAQARERTAVGQMMTDFTVKGDDGHEYKLSDYVGKGAYTLVDFWASWCGPCRREIPKIKKYFEEFNGKGMTFLGVAVWDNPADTRKAMKAMSLPWPVIVGDKKIKEPTDIYGINGIPHIIIFDPKGRIVSRGLLGDELAAKIHELMGE